MKAKAKIIHKGSELEVVLISVELPVNEVGIAQPTAVVILPDKTLDIYDMDYLYDVEPL